MQYYGMSVRLGTELKVKDFRVQVKFLKHRRLDVRHDRPVLNRRRLPRKGIETGSLLEGVIIEYKTVIPVSCVTIEVGKQGGRERAQHDRALDE